MTPCSKLIIHASCLKSNPVILSLGAGLILILGTLLLPSCERNPVNRALYDKALENGKAASEGLRRCADYLEAWLEYADPVTGLIPENLDQGIDR